ncbi:hypothetical protein ADS79_24935 [Brevibacillus reuszeri]|uniref:Uncharacterized protein n=1 Tax=Brevibacillus reuszeri TaxID=54915 RepID=A0A0K9YK86_9BACL|nr:hypothetical protein ADS79_24935 [Brevibacillus reuszeri]
MHIYIIACPNHAILYSFSSHLSRKNKLYAIMHGFLAQMHNDEFFPKRTYVLFLFWKMLFNKGKFSEKLREVT